MRRLTMLCAYRTRPIFGARADAHPRLALKPDGASFLYVETTPAETLSALRAIDGETGFPVLGAAAQAVRS